MDRTKVDAWVRFYDEVVVAGSDWPPELWFAAVGDAMAAALPADSLLYEQYQRCVAELLLLEANAEAGRSAPRVAALEAEIQRLIGGADAAIRAMPAVPATRPSVGQLVGAAPPAPARPGLRAAATAASGLLVVAAGLLGALYLYDSRLAAQVGDKVDGYATELRQSVGDMQKALAEQIARNRAEQERLATLQAELENDMASFSSKLSGSLEAMMALRKNAVADLEERLEEQTGPVAEMFGRVQERAQSLARGADEVAAEIVRLERRLPELGASLTRLAGDAEQGHAAFSEAMNRISAIDALAPELVAYAERGRAELDQALERGRGRFAELDQKLAALKGDYERSGEELAAARGALDDGLKQADRDRALLQAAIAEAQAASGMIEEIRTTAQAEIELVRSELKDGMDELLGKMAEQADLTLLRGEDVLERAQKQARERVQVASDEAAAAVAEARERELQQLAEHVAATRSELDQTRGELIQSWRRMDQMTAEHQAELIERLDAHAAKIEAQAARLLDQLSLRMAAKSASES